MLGKSEREKVKDEGEERKRRCVCGNEGAGENTRDGSNIVGSK